MRGGDSGVVSQFDELLDAFQHVHGAHDGIARHLASVLLMRNHDKVDRVRVVQLARVADDLLQLLRQTAQFWVFEGGGQRHQIVTETRHRVDGKLCRFQSLLGGLQRSTKTNSRNTNTLVSFHQNKKKGAITASIIIVIVQYICSALITCVHSKSRTL